MYLIITAAAAVSATVAWYATAPQNRYKLNVLCLIYWGAAIMWLCDFIVAYISEGGPFPEMSAEAALLGIVVMICGAAAWLVYLLVCDPKGVFKKILKEEPQK